MARTNEKLLQEAKRRLQIAQALHQFVQETKKGGTAGGKPVVNARGASAGAPGMATRPQRTDDQLEDRQLRQQQAEAAGIVRPGETFRAYGPHANPRAAEILQGGSGVAAGLGAARDRPDIAQAALAEALQRRTRGGRRRAVRAGGSG